MFILTRFYQSLIDFGHFLQPYFLLAIRLFWGWQFFKTGLGKFDDIEGISEFFGSLEIPMPKLNAYLAASTEMIGGLCLLIGFASRLVAIPLMFTMIVALLTAHIAATSKILEDPLTFIGQLPFTFLMTALIIFIFGPGLFSLDGLLRRSRES